MSTFVVECGPQVLDELQSGAPAGDIGAQLAERFADVLQGQPLMARSTIRWSSFLSVRNERWSHEHMVVLGDAAHAIHWSVGSGTMLALEDAWALAVAIRDNADPRVACADFESQRRPAVEGMRRLEAEMRRRLEGIDGDIDQPPLSLAYHLLRPI